MRYFTIAVLLFLCSFANAQQNLVPNPSFEDTVYCPNPTADIGACASWINWSQTPDYFNACNPYGGNVPNNSFGYQEAHSGNAYLGIVTYALPGPPGGPNYREIVASQLLHPLIIGKKYFLSFYVNCTFVGLTQIASNKMGISLTTVQYSAANSPPLLNFAQLYTDSIITDSLNWTKISGSFIADSTYSFVMLGNFFDDSHTDTLNLQPFPYNAYYFFDDLCISTDSLYNEHWTGLKNFDSDEGYKISISPNPVNDIMAVKNLAKGVITFQIKDILGRSCFTQKLKNEKTSYDFNLSFLNDGIYIFTVFDKFRTYSQRIIINH